MKIINGHYRDASGLLEPGSLHLEEFDGQWRGAHSGHRLFARRYAVATGIRAIEITSPDALTEFVPDAGECERIGMPVTDEA